MTLICLAYEMYASLWKKCVTHCHYYLNKLAWLSQILPFNDELQNFCHAGSWLNVPCWTLLYDIKEAQLQHILVNIIMYIENIDVVTTQNNISVFVILGQRPVDHLLVGWNIWLLNKCRLNIILILLLLKIKYLC